MGGSVYGYLHVKYPLVLFGFEDSALILPLFLLSPRVIMLCHCSSTMTKDHVLIILMAQNDLCVSM